MHVQLRLRLTFANEELDIEVGSRHPVFSAVVRD